MNAFANSGQGLTTVYCFVTSVIIYEHVHMLLLLSNGNVNGFVVRARSLIAPEAS